MKIIPLTQGQSALVSNEWYDRLMQRHPWENCRKIVNWCASWNRNTKSFYARRRVSLPNGKQMTEYMHRRILRLKLGDKRHTDHLNHDTLNNLPGNLRIKTCRGNHENMWNQSKHGVGVEFYQQHKTRPFRAHAWLNDKRHHIGMFTTAKEAQTARRAWLQKQKRKTKCNL